MNVASCIQVPPTPKTVLLTTPVKSSNPILKKTLELNSLERKMQVFLLS
ncbi:hypothetical protein SAMD00079811_60090 [Scytonema sp. HK-05]|nr:hypothetical protein SAMD00079811_60090 [Scytonema sp. HK-05]